MNRAARRPLVGITLDYIPFDYPADALQRHRDRFAINSRYIDAVLAAGGLPVLVPCAPEAELRAYLDHIDGILFTGCTLDYDPSWYGATPEPETRSLGLPRSESDRALMRMALASRKPVMGICAGFQLANISCGGRLVQHIRTPVRHVAVSMTEDAAHEVDIRPDTLLSRILGAGRHEVNSSHHQGVAPEDVGPDLRIVAMAPDGVIEALEPLTSDGLFRLFLQWHPERITNADQRERIFSAFVTACCEGKTEER